MGDFYMTLPSNSSTDTYPENSPASFQTKLPQTYNLLDYEVGLAEIQFSNPYIKLPQDLWISYKHDYDDHLQTYILPAGRYDSLATIVREINKLLENKKHRNKTKLVYDHTTQRVTLQVFKNEIITLFSPAGPFFRLPTEMISGPRELVSDGPIAPDTNSEAVYVYCDLVTHRQVGDVMVPLLRTIPTMDKTASLVYRIFEKPHYQPLSRSTFSTVEVLLRNGKGETPHFNGDIKTVVTLHLRPRKRLTS